MRNALMFLFLLAATTLSAQRGAPVLLGARAAAMGNAVVALSGIDGAFANQAGLASLENLTATLTGERRFGLGDIQSFAAAAALPWGKSVFALNLQYYGFEDFNEQKAGLAYARRLSPQLSIGGQFVLLSTRIPEYGNALDLTFELGLQAELLPQLTLGAHLFSPTRVEAAGGEFLPSILRVGAAYQPSAEVAVTLELEKDIDWPARTRGGVEYRIAELLALRVGFATAPASFSFGAGYRVGEQMLIDVGSYYHQILGFTPAISVTYQP